MDNQKDNTKWSHYVSLKGQKLTQAIYLVTSLLPDSEPLKWRLRDISLDILSDVSTSQPVESDSADLSVASGSGQLSPLFKVTVLESATLKIDQLISWLEVALAGNFSSDMNLVLIRNEYADFNKLLKEKVKTTGLNKLINLSKEDLFQSNPARPALPSGLANGEAKKFKGGDSIGHIDHGNGSYQKLSRLPHKNRDVAKDSRRSLIVGFLKGKDWTSIKDITEAIDGCSAKTIQRELSDLVHQGVLKKKGDRRWSRYLLS